VSLNPKKKKTGRQRRKGSEKTGAKRAPTLTCVTRRIPQKEKEVGGHKNFTVSVASTVRKRQKKREGKGGGKGRKGKKDVRRTSFMEDEGKCRGSLRQEEKGRGVLKRDGKRGCHLLYSDERCLGKWKVTEFAALPERSKRRRSKKKKVRKVSIQEKSGGGAVAP